MIPVERGPVLYLALEDTARRLTKRLRILCREAPPLCVEIITECPRLGMGGEDFLRVWLIEHPQARLIVIDTLARFRPVASPEDTLYAGDYAVGRYLSSSTNSGIRGLSSNGPLTVGGGCSLYPLLLEQKEGMEVG